MSEQMPERIWVSLDDDGDVLGYTEQPTWNGKLMTEKESGKTEYVRADRIVELEKERDDYKSRWEQTGCTRHAALEIALTLNKKLQSRVLSQILSREY